MVIKDSDCSFPAERSTASCAVLSFSLLCRKEKKDRQISLKIFCEDQPSCDGLLRGYEVKEGAVSQHILSLQYFL